MLMPKFKCSFKITTTVKKIFIVTDYEVDLTDEECKDADGIINRQTIKDCISTGLEESINEGDLQLEDEGKLVETDYDNDLPELIHVSKEL